MSCGEKAAAQIVLLMAGAAMLCFGVWRGEAATVLSKAIKLCLECGALGKKVFRRFTDHVPLPGLDSGGGDAADQPASAEFPQRRTVSGAGKTVCVPGLNCYSCPAASVPVPSRAFQAGGLFKFSFSYYITGFLILLGVLLGRFICGFLCPFGWFQELLHKIPTKKLSTKRLKPLTYLKYAVLLVMVFLLPAFLVNDVGMGDPFFCKYLCPQGVLEGAIPLSLANSGIRAALGKLFTWKFSILLSVIALSVLFYRPFCKWLCPLGAFYALFNRVSLFQMKVDKNKCVSCGKCARACKMDVDVTKTPNHTECIRCGMCIRACPTNAVCFRYGFGSGKETTKKTTMEESK